MLPASQKPTHWDPSWLRDVRATRRTLSQTKYGPSKMIGQGQLEANPIAIKPETVSYVAEQFSWVPLSCCSLPGCPFPIKSLALSAHVSPQTIHFQVLDKSPLSGSGRGPPSCNIYTYPFMM